MASVLLNGREEARKALDQLPWILLCIGAVLLACYVVYAIVKIIWQILTLLR